jgi:hypothetical protein
MKTLLRCAAVALLFAAIGGLTAQTPTVTVTVTVTMPQAYADALNTWRLRQKNPDGSLTYPTPQDALRFFIRSQAQPIIAAEFGSSITQ